MFGLGRRTGIRPQAAMRHHSIVTWETGHVRAAVLQLTGSTAEILGVSAAPVHGIGRAAHPDVDRWYAGCEKALSQAEDMTPATAGHKIVPDHVTMCVPSEVCQSLQVEVSEQRRNPARQITFGELVAAARASYRRAQDLVGESSVLAGDLVYGSIVDLAVDGKSLTNPVGFNGADLTLRASFHLAPVEWISALKAVATRLELLLTCVVPQHAAYGSIMAEGRALLLLLDEGHSQIALVRRGKTAAAERVDTGAQQIIDAVGSVLNLEGRRAAALLRAFRAGQLRDDFQVYVARAFWVELRRWMSQVADKALRMSGAEPPPPVIYYRDMTRRLPEAKEALGTPFWEEKAGLDCCPEIVELEASHARNVLDCTARASDAGYLLLRALAHTVAGRYAGGQDLERLLLDQVCLAHANTGAKRSR